MEQDLGPAVRVIRLVLEELEEDAYRRFPYAPAYFRLEQAESELFAALVDLVRSRRGQ